MDKQELIAALVAATEAEERACRAYEGARRDRIEAARLLGECLCPFKVGQFVQWTEQHGCGAHKQTKTMRGQIRTIAGRESGGVYFNITQYNAKGDSTHNTKYVRDTYNLSPWEPPAKAQA